MQLGQWLRAHRVLLPEAIDADLIAMHQLQLSRTQLITQAHSELDQAQLSELNDWVQARQGGMPLAYLIGEQGFWSLLLKVTPAVLIPRPETELLVETALEMLSGMVRPQVLDLGTGSGAIALAIAHSRPDARVVATDFSPAALDVARANGQRLGLPVEWIESDWFSALRPDQRFDLIVSNPPYLAESDPHLPSLRCEPPSALIAAKHGLGDIATIITGAVDHMRPGASLWIEHGNKQDHAVRALFAADGRYTAVTTRADLEQRPRISGGRATSSRYAADFRVD